MNRKRGPCVVLAAGGTGGHMFPAQALARELITRGKEVVLVTDRRGAGFGPELPQVETQRISAGAIAGGSLTKKLGSVFSLTVGYFQVRALLKSIRPEAVVGFGGYASVPTVFAASRLGLRVVLHEQNAVLGRANRLMARRADVIATSFEKVEGLPGDGRAELALTGNPVRPAVTALSRRPFALPGGQDRLRLLVTGGSQGARVFNGIIPDALCRLPEDMRQRLHVSQQVRSRDLAEVEAEYRACGISASLASFFEDLPERLASAHLVVCRSGASTLAELTAAGRPAILVPYPFATDDHQTTNARALAEAGGGWLLPQSALTPDSLAERLASLLSNPTTLTQAARCARAMAQIDAAARLADLVPGKSDDNGGEDDREEAAA